MTDRLMALAAACMTEAAAFIYGNNCLACGEHHWGSVYANKAVAHDVDYAFGTVVAINFAPR